MSAFFVGQRVRLARPKHPENLGATGRISKLFPPRATDPGWYANCTVKWDRTVIGNVSHTDQLEPILPDGMKPARWEDCMWMPDGIREPVMDDETTLALETALIEYRAP